MYRALVMLLHFMIGLLAMICAMGYREGLLDWEWFFPWVYMIFVSVPLGGLIVCSHERYCVKRKDWDEDRRRQVLRIIGRVEERIVRSCAGLAGTDWLKLLSRGFFPLRSVAPRGPGVNQIPQTFAQTGDDSGASDAPSQLQRDLHIVLEEACTDLGIVDPLFKVIAIGQGVHNMHARLAWIGGLGRAQDDIAAQIALFRQDPGAEQVERLAHTIEHHLNALGDSSVPSFRDLARLRGGTGNKTLILIEMLKIVSFIPACLLLAATPQAPNQDLDCIVLIIYSVIALVPSFLLGSLALVGFFDHAFAHRGVTEMQGAHTAAAQLEHYARYHLVGWAALLRLLKSDSDSDIAERVAAVEEALFENIVASASAHSISQMLDYKLDRPMFSSDVDFYRSSARVCRSAEPSVYGRVIWTLVMAD
uniref:Uncharacterized protein n=1 Tax=Schizophyllum commune (strain H4-8 / FGSC 9210) TaxID=578458 RepID=D8QMC0_SCHCM